MLPSLCISISVIFVTLSWIMGHSEKLDDDSCRRNEHGWFDWLHSSYYYLRIIGLFRLPDDHILIGSGIYVYGAFISWLCNYAISMQAEEINPASWNYMSPKAACPKAHPRRLYDVKHRERSGVAIESFNDPSNKILVMIYCFGSTWVCVQLERRTDLSRSHIWCITMQIS